MPNNTNQTSSEFPGIPQPRADINSVVASVMALKQSVEVLIGVRGSGDNQAATQADIAALKAQIAALTPQP